MTQQDIINELNRMVVGYNINWDMIKYDADRAIMKINAHLGAEYPMMSSIMLSPRHRYTIRYKNEDVPIFPERYMLTVVIPFIASEVLARDEEFTTIYNKYVMDFENGLFDMFQNEYNKVPPVFRQDKDVGVFFSKDIQEHSIHEHRDAELPEFAFNVYYHLNFEGYRPTTQLTVDVRRYKYNSTVTVLDSTIKSFIKDLFNYTFSGWALSPEGSTTQYNEGDEIKNITGDVHLYAQWNSECVLDITSAGVLSIKESLADKLTTLIIPPYVNGTLVKTIPSGFNTNASNLVAIVLPRTNLTIATGAINNTALKSLVLPSYDYLRDYPKNVVIETGALVSHSLSHLYIPYSVSTIGSEAINDVPKVSCEIDTKPTGWNEMWTDTATTIVEWGVANV